MPTCIAVIHATRAAVASVEESFGRLWPEAETISLLDESLSRDLGRIGELTPAMFGSVERLARFAQEGGAQGILYSCSAFGEAIEATRATMDIPVLKPNEAMLEDALVTGGHICLSATFRPTITSVRRELFGMAEKRGVDIEIEDCYIPGALEATLAGNEKEHDRLISETIGKCSGYDTVLLAQFSMARALPAVAERTEARILTSPDSAVHRLRELIHPSSEYSLFAEKTEVAGSRSA